MVRSYKQKNPYFKNTRLSIEQSERIILMYLKGVKTSKCAEFIGVSKNTVSRGYKKLDAVIFSGEDNGNLFFFYFNRYLERYDDQDALRYMLHTIRGMLVNLDKPKYTREMRLRDGWDDFIWEETLLHTPHLLYLWGMWEMYPNSNNLEACIYTCSSETPPLVVNEKIENGQRQEVIERRIACQTCPIKLKQVYDPPWGKPIYPCVESEGRTVVYEPYREYMNDENEIMVFWIDMLWFLSHSRNLKLSEQELKTKVMQAAYFSALKRGEYKVSENVAGGAGVRVPTSLMYPEQIEAMKRGVKFSSHLDHLAVRAMCDVLSSEHKG